MCHVQILDAMNQDSELPLASLRVDGGMTVNHTLLQLQADLLGIPVGEEKERERGKGGGQAMGPTQICTCNLCFNTRVVLTQDLLFISYCTLVLLFQFNIAVPLTTCSQCHTIPTTSSHYYMCVLV